MWIITVPYKYKDKLKFPTLKNIAMILNISVKTIKHEERYNEVPILW